MSNATKESFSGPSEVIGAARTAAETTYGKQNGAWSRWVCDAVREKLIRDGHTLPEAKQVIAEAITEAELEGIDVVDVLSRAVIQKRARTRKTAA